MENQPEIKTVAVTRTIYYTPEAYITICKDNGSIPSQEEFDEFVQTWAMDDFEAGFGEQTIEIIQ